jgi:predicted ATPase/transcriptional regulator with XRE-family HTH domain
MDNYSFYAKTKPAEFEPKKKYQPHELLVMLRQRSGLSKTELAKLLGLASERMIQKWEGGYSVPPADRLRQLIEIYHAKKAFLSGKELEEVRLLWTTIQNYYDATHPSYEGFPVFDVGWFEKSFKEQTNPPLLILPHKADTPLFSEAKAEGAETLVPPNNLPAPELTEFVGRQTKLTEIGQLITQDKHRLVTLSGTGGIGKTRLALQIARQSLPAFKDGVWLVELAGLSTAEQLPLFVAKALDLFKKLPADDLLSALQKQLKTKQLLIVLDNCEHLLSACAGFADSLLKNCPQIQILATSRERFGILGELALPLLPLTFPSINLPTPLPDLLEYEAIRLFCNRAKLIEPMFEPTAQNATALVEICQKLDGIPLALELAAARLTTLTLAQINQRLTDRFKLLNQGNRTALPRHQTLRTLLDWSFQLLLAQEQTLFRRLAVFSGGWTLEAAEAICSDTDLEAEEILDVLDSLVAKSLVVVDKQDHLPRYRMLETIRQYAGELFAPIPEALVFQERHSAYYTQLAEQAEKIIEIPEQIGWLKQLDKEHENFSNIFSRLTELQNKAVKPSPTHLKLALRLAAALARYWRWRGYGRQARGWLEQSLTMAEQAGITEGNDEETLKLLMINWLRLCQQSAYQDDCEVAISQGEKGLALAEKIQDKTNIGLANRLLCWLFRTKADYSRAEAYIEQSLAIYRELNDVKGIASAGYEMALLAYQQNQNAKARQYIRECIATWEKGGSKNQLATSYNVLSMLHRESGDYPNARLFLEKAIMYCREVNDRGLLGILLNNLAVYNITEGYYAETLEMLEQALSLTKEAGTKNGEALSFQNLGSLFKGQADYQTAKDYYEQALSVRQEMNDRIYIAYTLNNLGEIAVLQNDYTRARELLNSGLAQAQTMQHKLPLAQAYLYLGYLEYKESNYPAAREYLEKAIEIQAERQNYHEMAKSQTWLICISFQEGKTAEAKGQIEKLNQLLASTTGVLEPHYRTELAGFSGICHFSG